MTIFKCVIPETKESIYLPEIQETAEQSPFDDVEVFDECYPSESAFHGKNREGRDVQVCDIDELVTMEEPE